MAINQERNISEEFHQGVIDNSYMQLHPNRGGAVENRSGSDRVTWPTYAQVERHSQDTAEGLGHSSSIGR